MLWNNPFFYLELPQIHIPVCCCSGLVLALRMEIYHFQPYLCVPYNVQKICQAWFIGKFMGVYIIINYSQVHELDFDHVPYDHDMVSQKNLGWISGKVKVGFISDYIRLLIGLCSFFYATIAIQRCVWSRVQYVMS